MQDLKSRVIRICRSILPLFRLWLYLCVWVWAEAEASPASPPTLLPIHHFYLCLCRLDYTSLPILPFMPLLLRFPLSSGNLPISWKLASFSWIVNTHVNKWKYKPYWFPKLASWTWLLHASSSQRCIVTPPDKRKDKADTLIVIEQSKAVIKTVDAVFLVVIRQPSKILHESDDPTSQ